MKSLQAFRRLISGNNNDDDEPTSPTLIGHTGSGLSTRARLDEVAEDREHLACVLTTLASMYTMVSITETKLPMYPFRRDSEEIRHVRGGRRFTVPS